MDLKLHGKAAIVTGGSKGIGRATAEKLAAEGAEVLICARGLEDLQQAATHIASKTGKQVQIAQVDVTDEAGCKRVVEQALAAFGRLDIVINNAGTAAAAPFEVVEVDKWRADLDLKLFGAIHFSKAALPALKQSGAGAIVNVTTSAAKTPGASSLPTSVSRAAGLALTKAMSRDLAPDGIRVNTVGIGLIHSDQLEKVWQRDHAALTWEQFAQLPEHDIPLGRIGEAEEAANTIVFLVSGAASYITGTSVNIDGGKGAAL